VNKGVTSAVAPIVANKPIEVTATEKEGGKNAPPENGCRCIGTNNHDAFNLKSEFIAGYADTILRGIACGGNCGVKQVIPSTTKPVWLCPDLNSGKGSICNYALCNACFGIANIGSAPSSRRRTKKIILDN
jgi:hypothetical protein